VICAFRHCKRHAEACLELAIIRVKPGWFSYLCSALSRGKAQHCKVSFSNCSRLSPHCSYHTLRLIKAVSQQDSKQTAVVRALGSFSSFAKCSICGSCGIACCSDNCTLQPHTHTFKASSFAQRLLSGSSYSMRTVAAQLLALARGSYCFCRNSSTKTIETGYDASRLSNLLLQGHVSLIVPSVEGSPQVGHYTGQWPP
jgi:hypothetical protein